MNNENGISFNQTCVGVLITGIIVLGLLFSGLGSFLSRLLTPASPAVPTPVEINVPQAGSDQRASAAASPIPALSADQRQSLVQAVSRSIQIRTNADDASQPFTFVLEAEAGTPIRSLAFSPDESLLAAGLENGLIVVWTLTNLNSSGQVAVQILAEHVGAVSSLAFDMQNGQRLASGSADTTIRLWDVSRGQVTATLVGHQDNVSALAFIPNNPLFVSGSADTTIKLWDVNTGQTLATMQGHTGPVFSLDVEPSAGNMISGGGDNQIIIWDLATQRSVINLAGHADWVSGLAYLPPGMQMASTSYDKTARIWTLNPPQAVQLPLEPPPGSALIDIAAHASGKLLAMASSGNSIYLWDIANSTQLTLPQQTLTTMTAVEFSPQGNFLAASSLGGTIRLWRTRVELIDEP